MMRMTGFMVALVVMAAIISSSINGKEFSYDQEIKVERLLKRLNKPALKSIKSEDGDIIDCVLITKQPAFDHPLLKNHTIQMRPSFIPDGDQNFTNKEAKAITQVWHKNGKCPKNTVPIRRIQKEDILRAKSIESFGKKTYQSPPEDYDPSRGHEYGIMNTRNGKYFGTKFSINVWNPYVQTFGEFSLAQTWLVSGTGSALNTIEVGWQVSQQIYGDTRTRLFVYWTATDYLPGSGCYNLNCPGFFQRSNIFTVGGWLAPLSQYSGTQYELSILIWKDIGSGNWWLKIGEELVGYWPSKLFTSLGDGATRVQWGGEIVNLRTGGKHTATDMGSGSFADEGFGKSSYFRNLMIVDGANTLREPQGLYPYNSNFNCYNVKAATGGTWGSYFFYGGSGLNMKCP